MWAKGRYDTTSSSAVTGLTPRNASVTQRIEPWDSIAPFGGPVVPEV